MLKIVEATREDVGTLSAIEKLIFQYDVISPRQMLYLLKSATATIVKAEVDSNIVGYMVLLRRKNSKVLRIYSIGILAALSRLGIGLEFLRYAEQCSRDFGCNRLQIEVHTLNKIALMFFFSAGFCLYGRKSNYYTDGAMALLLRKWVE